MIPRPWSLRDIANLRAFAKRGDSNRVAAKKLRRSPGAVRYKAHVMRIRFVSLGRAFSRAQRERYKNTATAVE